MNAAERFDSLIQYWWEHAASRWGFAPTPWTLGKAQVHAESNFNPAAVSSAGAVGLLQLMPTTALLAGVKDRTNPEESLRAGFSYLGELWAEFKAETGRDRWALALASYNSGLGHLLRAQAKAKAAGNDSSQWADVSDQLPVITGPHYAAETIGYVTRILAEAWPSG